MNKILLYLFWVFIIIFIFVFVLDNNEENIIENIENNVVVDTIYNNEVIDESIDVISEKQIINKELIKYKVTNIIDWDTIDILYNWEEQRLRLIWIDTPENTTLRYWYIECYWEESKDYLNSLLNWKEISIEFDETQWILDNYWRMLVYVFLDWVNINNKLIKDWYAFEYTYDKAYKYIDEFKTSQYYAKNNKLWLWSEQTCNWNRIINSIEKNNFIQDTKILIENNCIIKWNISLNTWEKIYHVPWCENYNDTVITESKGEKWFCTEEEAIKAGWRKALNCN